MRSAQHPLSNASALPRTMLGSVLTTVIGSLLAIVLMVGVFAAAFLYMSGKAPPMNNRGQSQIRTPAEEAQANLNWNPNRELELSQPMPEENSWAATFGQKLSDPSGVDADDHLIHGRVAEEFIPSQETPDSEIILEGRADTPLKPALQTAAQSPSGVLGAAPAAESAQTEKFIPSTLNKP